VQFPDVHPIVLGTIITARGLRALARGNLPADAAEVRVDALLAAGVALDPIEAALKARRLPVLLTLRIPAEGGHMPWQPRMRRETYLRLLPEVEAIDVELASMRALAPVIAAAESAGKTIVYSAHAIERPATPARFAQWIPRYAHRPHAILKIAARIKSWRDLQQLAAVLVNHPDWHVAVMGLGPYAAPSRSVLTALGSRLVYGYLDEPAAPGQPSAREVRQMADTFRMVG
jgi:3-dehydroquinate dehydratase-1